MKIRAFKVNAFTDRIDGGNPAGVVIDPPGLSDKQMSIVSQVLNVSETAFVFKYKDHFRVRFFSPKVEVDLCGHATVAAFYILADKGLISKNRIIQKTKAGNLEVKIDFDGENKVRRVMMTQSKPIYKDIYLDILNLSNVFNIEKESIDVFFPFQKVSTGLFTLPVCIKNFKILKSIKPDFEKVRNICKKCGVGSIHLFTFDTIDKDSIYHARNFAPMYGINEDPVTGTANGAVCSYLVKNNIVDYSNFICEQGDIINKSGRVHVEIKDNIVKVGGKAKFVEKRVIDI
jgi:PhzF family phenazine biosynthesis protein